MPIQYRSDQLLKSLAALHAAAPGLIGSAISTNDGLVIAVYPPGWDNDIQDPTGGEHVAAMSAVVASMAERTMVRLEQGELERDRAVRERDAVGATHEAGEVLLEAPALLAGPVVHAARAQRRDGRGHLVLLEVWPRGERARPDRAASLDRQVVVV